MKRILLIMMVVLLCAAWALPVSAQSRANLRSEATVNSDGSCRVTLNAAIRLEEPAADLSFPIPVGASSVTLNGAAVNGRTQGQALLIPLKGVTGGMAGEFSVSIAYTMAGVVTTPEPEKGEEEPQEGLLLTLPILCGFAYPVESLSFSVSLPGEVTTSPGFTSAYHQENIISELEVAVSGSTVTGSASNLKDHETLTMTLAVDESMFPETAATARVLGAMDIAIMVVILLAILYYVLALRPARPKKVLRSTAPDGISAGETALWLTGRGVDLSLLVVTWAQLGYLRLHVDDSGRVMLHKRMEMGNERSAFENRCYKNLFGRRRTVDGTGYHYAELCRSVARQMPQAKNVYRSRSGNPKIFLGVCALAALLSGITLAGAFAPHSTFLRIFLALLTTVMAVFIQAGGRCIPVRERLPLWIGLGCSGVWIILGLCAGEFLGACLMVIFQFLSGLAAAYSGKRTELGQHVFGQILGLRKFMGSVSKKELQRILKGNPGYFHDLAPYALALGVDRRFARRFERLRLPECTYLMGGRSQMTAAEWAAFLRTAVQTMDTKAKRLPLERFTRR